MSNSLKHLLNPVDENGVDADIPMFGSSYIGGDMLSNHEDTQATWNGYDGQVPRIGGYHGPGVTDFLSDVPVLHYDEDLLGLFNPINFDNNIDAQLFMDLNLDGLGLENPVDPNFLEPSMVESSTSEDPSPGPSGTTLSTLPSPSPFPVGSQTSREESNVAESNVAESNVAESNDQPVSPASDNHALVCYGMLQNIEVKLVGEMQSIVDRLKEPKSVLQYFDITKHQQDHAVICFKGDKMKLGYLRSSIAKTLLPLVGAQTLDLEPIALKSNLWTIIDRANKPNEAMVKVDINIYGPRRESKGTGKVLSEGKLWLQRPDHSRKEYVYENPHFLHLDMEGIEPEPMESTVQQTSTDNAPRRKKREDQLSKMVEEVYKAVDNRRDFEMVEGGSRVTQKLLEHQQAALGFMLERESGNINDKYRLWQEITLENGTAQYRHKITKARRSAKPEEKGGGILADEMGMGKTLSILALVMMTLESGQEWAIQENEEPKGRRSVRHSRSTLIVVSSALLISNWQNEIDRHLDRGLKVIQYHGSKRVKDLQQIEDSDIVITTYNTLAAEFPVKGIKSSVLHQISWYRVVLDEAHVIRCRSTSFFRSCDELQANSRWCLTGTPIQNKLADIGTLFAFIRAEPFIKPSVFRRHIETPFEQTSDNPEQVKKRLTLLMEALCLRRTTQTLTLPGVRQYLRTLNFSPEEREQYENTQQILVRTIKQRVGEIEKSSKFGLFQMKLQLRILCNHGTFQKPNSWCRRSLLNEKEAIIGSFGTSGDICCSVCSQPMPVLGSNLTRGMFDGKCAHVLCSECIHESTTAGSRAQSQGCPICVEWNQPSAEDDHAHYFNNDGFATKMNALVGDVGKDLWTTKSIVFSCWTRTLYLVSEHLKKANIPFRKIDGDCPLLERERILAEFAEKDDMPVLIMTTGTGAFGLNLTCANRIFIVELQWNPSVENQAIARAIRLGQKREVRVMRYVIKDTVEEEMRQQQQYKKQIAAIGFDEVPELIDAEMHIS